MRRFFVAVLLACLWVVPAMLQDASAQPTGPSPVGMRVPVPPPMVIKYGLGLQVAYDRAHAVPVVNLVRDPNESCRFLYKVAASGDTLSLAVVVTDGPGTRVLPFPKQVNQTDFFLRVTNSVNRDFALFRCQLVGDSFLLTTLQEAGFIHVISVPDLPPSTAVPDGIPAAQRDAASDGRVVPPPGYGGWTPGEGQFQLYVNFDGDTVPRIAVLCNNVSWPIAMEQLQDTVHIFAAPPGYVPNNQSLNNLETEFPLVVWAGTERATFWFSYDSGRVSIDTLQPAPFISVVSVRPLPGRTLTLQLQGTGKNAKTIRSILNELGDRATLVQLEDGFYQKLWLPVSQSVVQRWKTNETIIGTLLVFQYAEGSAQDVAKVLQKYKGEEYADANRK